MVPNFNVKFKKLHPEAKIPTRATPGSAGMDLYSVEAVWLQPGEFKAVSTGLACSMPPIWELQIRPRSGMAAKYGVTVLNAPGTIDSDYRGEIKVLLVNHGKEVFKVSSGDRIAQMVIGAVANVETEEIKDLDSTERGTGGFGSTGV